MLVESPEIQVAQIIPCTEAEGPGRRFALWFQGCPLRCPGCCNPEFLSFRGGETYSLTRLILEIEAAHKQGIEGITLLGGEPFAHLDGAVPLAEYVQSANLSVMIFTGYRLEQLRERNDPLTERLLAATDILVDGPYLREQPDRERRWIGSTNQRIHFFTPRYRSEDECWKQRNTIEIRLDLQSLTVNGFPAESEGAIEFWKGKFRRR
jgi:anaerobic ribonucleoside-triphosphate reductase activating protein